MRLFIPLAIVASLLHASAWGAAGHEIVATIAQIHLHPSVRTKLCDILPPEAKGHLAPIAAWADRVRFRYPATAPMHYINPKQDHPADHCEYGEDGWINENVNVLTAIMNETTRLMDGEGDIPLRFLTHFVGDMHQPLHLSGRDKGGNGAMFSFEGHHRNLHSVWDSGLITKKIRELGNYTTPTRSKQIESSLIGAIFDPYVRFIVWEGIRLWWPSELESWLACPSTGDPYPHSSLHSSVPPSSPPIFRSLSSVSPLVLHALPPWLAVPLTLKYPIPLSETIDHSRALLAIHPANLNASTSTSKPIQVCPFTWSKPLHQLNCDIIWPKEYTGDHDAPLIELDTDAYYGRLTSEKTVEKLLAMAGIRLAHIINTSLSESEQSIYMSYKTWW